MEVALLDDVIRGLPPAAIASSLAGGVAAYLGRMIDRLGMAMSVPADAPPVSSAA